MVNISRITTIFGNPYKGHMNVCVCVCVCARVRVRVRVCFQTSYRNWIEHKGQLPLRWWPSCLGSTNYWTKHFIFWYIIFLKEILSLVVVYIHNGMSIQCWSFHHLICLFYETFWLCTWRLMETTRIIAISMAFKSANIGTKKQLW